MAVSTKAIKGRIKSVKNTKKITKAMEMVSAAKMRKAVEATMNTRLYASLALELMERMSELEEPNFPLFEVRPAKKVLMVLIGSNRGLCGSFNSNLFKFSKKLIDEKKNLATHRSGDQSVEPEGDVQIDVLGVGRKSAAFAKKHGLHLTSVYDTLSEKPTPEDVVAIAREAIDTFRSGEYDKTVVVYTDFKSSLVQVPKVRQILPLSNVDLGKMLDSVPEGTHEVEKDEIPMDCYYLEPDRDTILEMVIPRLVEIQLFQAVLESSASEHSARMVAMKNASESAGDMIKALTREFNKARQAAITQEIAEIAGGAAALE